MRRRPLWSTKETLSHPAEVFLSFLTSWLALHVLGIDQSMARLRLTHAAQLMRQRRRQPHILTGSVVYAVRCY